MKKSEFRKLIREEIKKYLSESPDNNVSLFFKDLEKYMKEYGAIPGDWRHFWDDVGKSFDKYIKK